MKRFALVLVALLALASSPSAQTRTAPTCVQANPHSAVMTSLSTAEIIATQDRVNRYMHRDIVPAIRDCWARLNGRGTIQVRLQYERSGDRWLAGPSTVRRSTLASGEDEVALRCLQAAVAGTGFPVEAADREAPTYVVNWSFPVPMPRDDAEAILVALDNGSGPGGGNCGGPEDPPACWDCGYIPIVGISLCMPTCAGYLDCLKIPNGCQFSSATRCVTGGVFRNLSGIAVYPR